MIMKGIKKLKNSTFKGDFGHIALDFMSATINSGPRVQGSLLSFQRRIRWNRSKNLNFKSRSDLVAIVALFPPFVHN